MIMRTRTTHYHTVTVNGIDIELKLPVTPSVCMSFLEPKAHVGKETILVAYLADDQYASNPLDDDNFAGSIYEARRHGSTLEDYCRALGLREDGGGPDLGLVDEETVVAAAIEKIQGDANLTYTAVMHCDQYWERRDSERDWEFILRCLDSINELTPVIDVPTLQLELWRAGRAAGTIGAKHTITLDVYEHGGISYSVSGSGMQCQFDTARGGAVWVPSAAQLEDIEERGPVYQKGSIIINRLRNQYRITVRTWDAFGRFDDVVHPTFDHWSTAFTYLQGYQHAGYCQPLEDALDDVARGMAKLDAETYTHYRNGNCFDGVLAIYDLDGRLLEVEETSGYIDSADDALAQFVSDYFEHRKDEA